MSTTPDPKSPAASTTPSPAPASESAASSDKPKFDKNALVKRMAAKVASVAKEEPTLSPEDAEEPAAAAREPETPAKSRADIVRERLQAKAQERHAAQSKQSEAREADDLRRQLEQVRGTTGVDAWLDKFERDPVVALREAKRDPTKVLKLLTKDALSQGSVRRDTETDAEIRKAREIAERAEARLEEREVRDYWANEDREFSKLVADEKKFPLAAKLDGNAKLRLAGRILREWNEQGIGYDRDLLADALEAELEEVVKSTTPKKEPPKEAPTPSSSTSENPSTPQVAAKPKTKAPTKTLTAEVTSQSGARGESTPEQRKSRIIERLNRKLLAARAAQ